MAEPRSKRRIKSGPRSRGFARNWVAILSHTGMQFLSSARNFCLKKSSPKTPSFGVQFAVPSPSAGYEPIDSAFSGVLDSADAHTLARSEMGFATEKCRVAVELRQLRGHQIPV
jgi:hypothetical protein